MTSDRVTQPLSQHLVLRTNAQEESTSAKQPTYEDLFTELQAAKAQLAQTEAELQAAIDEQYQTAEHLRRCHCSAQSQGGSSGQSGGGGGDDTGRQAQNPVGALWMLWFQNDMKLLEGPLGGKRIFNTTVFQPVMPIKLNDNWRLINRPVLTFNAFEVPNPFNFRPGGSQDPPAVPTDPFDTKWGLGDTIYAQYFSGSGDDDTFLWGIGDTWMFPTATDRDLGTGKYAGGPALLGIWLGEKWIFGGIMQQWWSFAGKDDRLRVALMDIQVPFRYRINPMTSLGMAPNIQWDQVTGKWTVPLGFGFDSTTKTTGGKPLRTQVEDA